MEKKIYETSFAGRPLTLEIGELAQKADAAVKARYGDTVVLATVVMGKYPREGINYFPLTVDFDEKLYAAGRIKGSRWIKREGRPTDEAILSARMIDRTIRPLFNSRVRNEVQVVVTNLSFDGENDPDIPAIIAVSTALAISDIPWAGPVAALRIGKSGENYLFNPTYAERETSLMDVVIAGPGGLANMIEAKASEVSEKDLSAGLEKAQEELKQILQFQNKIAAEIGEKKIVLPQSDEELRTKIRSATKGRLEEFLFRNDMEAVNVLKKDVIAESIGENYSLLNEADLLFEEELDRLLHQNILLHTRRPDGRALDEIRPLRAEVGVLPRTHGSGLFERGETQAFSVLTLGAPGLEQSLETMEFVGTKRYIHHYNFPPFSTGETGRIGAPGRREIGHGALAEKALESVIPPKDKFPYTIRIVSEILSSNGSTSMAAVCGSTLALMDAGVPITSPVAGISIGLMTESETDPQKNYRLLTDIQGPEDHHGDMDFKAAGTEKGLTAIQMDTKIRGLTPPIIGAALEEAKKARLKILGVMSSAIASPRANLSPYAPRILTITIDPEKIRNVIGPGGKVINQITGETGVTIDIEDSGLIFITSNNEAEAKRALEWISNITHEVKPGEIFTGRVTRILNFGAFVEILPGQQGLVHISELAPRRVEKVEDIVKTGDMVKVRVKNIDNEGRINLSMKEF